ncbi:hypothetical protein P3L10_021211 [Capsicum annuum]
MQMKLLHIWELNFCCSKHFWRRCRLLHDGCYPLYEGRMINLSPPCLFCECKCDECKAKYDGVINTVNALTTDVKELISKSVIRSKRISVSFTPLNIKAKRRKKAISKELSSIQKINSDLKKDGKKGRISPSLANTENKTSDVIEPLDYRVKFDNPEDVFARVSQQIKRSQSPGFSVDQSSPIEDKISTELLDKTKDDIERLLIMSSQDLLLP